MKTQTNSTAPEGCAPPPCSGSSCPCEKCENYRKYLAWLETERSKDGIFELIEENRLLKDQLAYLSESKATEMLRLSDMIDKREEALGHIAAIMREKDENCEDLLIGSTAWKSVIRWSIYFQIA